MSLHFSDAPLPRAIPSNTIARVTLTRPSLGSVSEYFGDGVLYTRISKPQSHELNACSPVLSHADIQRIHNNVGAQYNAFYANFINVGGSLDATGMMAQYRSVWNAAEGGSYCTYQNDAPLAQETVEWLDATNTIFNNDCIQYTNTFNAHLQPMRAAYSSLQQVTSNVSYDLGPSIDAYNNFIKTGFAFALYQGMTSALDSYISEYDNYTNTYEQLFDRANEAVQSNFIGTFNVYKSIYNQLIDSYKKWDTVDGYDGYMSFSASLSPFQANLTELSKFVVLDTPQNKQIFNDINTMFTEVKTKWNYFPNFVQCTATNGIILDSGTSAHKFYARQLVLNVTQAVGAQFITTISTGESLIVTGLSYQHGGKMPPHKEHKDGRDCDLFSIRFKLGETTFSSAKTVSTIVYLLQNGVSRVIYTDDAVVSAANQAVPGNPVAKNLPGHTTHIHFEMDKATFTVT